MDCKLTENQIKALNYCYKKSKIFSKQIYPNLVEKFIKNNLAIEDIKKVNKYIKSVPIIIHFKVKNIIDFLVSDDHYRNQFETGTSGGSLNKINRTNWEKNLFNGIYETFDYAENSVCGVIFNENSADVNNCKNKDSERVKYGAINIGKNPNGCASSYGESYIVLKEKVKKRTSFVFGDSSRLMTEMMTFRHHNPLIYYLNDNSFEELIELAIKGKKYSKHNFSPYVECQFHGPINLKKDVEYLVIDDMYKNDILINNKLNTFTEIHNVPYMWKSEYENILLN